MVIVLAGTFEIPKTVLLKTVGIKVTADRYTRLKAALIPNFAIVIYNGIIEMSSGKMRSKKAPTIDSEKAEVNDFLGPTDAQTKTLTTLADASAS